MDQIEKSEKELVCILLAINKISLVLKEQL